MITGFDGCGKKTEKDGAGVKNPVPTKQDASSDVESTPTPEPGKMVVTLYFSDENAEKLVAEHRQIPKTPAVATAIIRELQEGPREIGLYPTLPKQMKLRGVRMSGDVAVVDLSKVRAPGIGGAAAEMMIVYSMVNSLTELPNVKSVRFLVDGKKRDVLLDAFDITNPVTRDTSLIRR